MNKIPYDITFHPSWWHQNAGIDFSAPFFDDPHCRIAGVDLGSGFVPHGSLKELHKHCGLDAAGIAEYTKEVLSR